MSLVVNAKMHESEAGIRLWQDYGKIVFEARKLVPKNCHYIRPLVSIIIYGIKWEDSDTDKMYNDIRYWEVNPCPKSSWI